MAEKALEEANARMAITEVRLRVLVVEKDAAIQVLSQEKISRANVKLSLVEEKEWRVG